METILTGILAFASTNTDDIFILTLFYSDKQYKPTHIYVGQYLGIVALVALSVLGSLIGNYIDQAYIGLLGLLSIYPGLKQMTNRVRKKQAKAIQPNIKKNPNGILKVAAVTLVMAAITSGFTFLSLRP